MMILMIQLLKIFQFTSIHINSHLKSTSIHIIEDTFDQNTTPRSPPPCSHDGSTWPSQEVTESYRQIFPTFAKCPCQIHHISVGNNWKWLEMIVYECFQHFSTERCWLNPIVRSLQSQHSLKLLRPRSSWSFTVDVLERGNT